VRGDLRTLGAT